MTEDRTRLSQDLREIADLVDEAPDEVVERLLTAFRAVAVHVFGDDDKIKATMADFARTAARHGSTVTKDYGGDYAFVFADWGAARIRFQTYRESVCERVVVGTETVTKTVKDPELLDQVPEVEITEDVEVYEWRCSPLLEQA